MKGLAGNLGFGVADTDRYVSELLEAGELVEADPVWDYTAYRWVALARPDDHGTGCDGPYNCTCGAVK